MSKTESRAARIVLLQPLFAGLLQYEVDNLVSIRVVSSIVVIIRRAVLGK